MVPYDIKRFCLLYFSCGSNMDESEMNRPGKCSSAMCTDTGCIHDKMLVFNKVSKQRIRVANIKSNYGDRILRFFRSTATTGEDL